MAKIKPISILDSLSGKLDKDDGIYLYTNKKTGKQTTRHIGNKSDAPRTPAQIANSARFAEISRKVTLWFSLNKTPQTPEGTDEYKNVMAKYNSQNKYGHPNHFVRHLISIGEIQLPEQ